MYYIDYHRNMYANIDDYYKKKSLGIVKSKSLLNSKKILAFKDKELLYENTNVQGLYLYPCTILDYIQYAFEYKTLMYNVLDLEKIEIERIENSEIKNIEFLINKETMKTINKIIGISEKLKRKGCYISYNMKTLDIPKELLAKLCSNGDYLKIQLNNKINKDQYVEFLNRINFVKENINQKSLVHIKTFLSIIQAKNYKKMTKDFAGIVDVFQVSKELMPIDANDNPKVDISIQQEIRRLENEVKIFISVKDISTLYYPRFELDERNSRECFSCFLKPYIYREKLLPCKVKEVIENLDDWYIGDSALIINKEKLKKCGKECSDCASIFENDILHDITNRYNNSYNFLLEIDE